MMRPGFVAGKLRLVMVALALSGTAAAQTSDFERGMKLGGIRAFAEMVSVGVKELALSSTLSAAELESLRDEALAIAEHYNIRLYEEDDLLVTDLFPHDVAVDKQVLLSGPVQAGHERMRWPISSFEMVFCASESARPRRIMT